MVIYVKNNLVTIKGSSHVVDENGNKLYEVEGKLFSPTKKKFVKDLNGNILYIVRNKFWHMFLKKAFIIDGKTNAKYCKVKEKFFGRAVTVVNCKDEITMKSQGLFKGIAIHKNGKHIGTWWIGSNSVTDLFIDSYRLEVFSEEDCPLLISLIIAIDNIDDTYKDRN